MVMKKFEMYAKLHDSQRRFNRACDQIQLLNTRLRGLRKRYTSARSTDSKTFRFPPRMRVMAVEGLVKTYYHYADMKRNEILKGRAELAKLDIDENEEEVYVKPVDNIDISVQNLDQNYLERIPL